MTVSHVAAAHAIIASMSAAEVRFEQKRRSADVDRLSRACEHSPTPANHAALRTALDAAWPYTHAVGMLQRNGL